MHPYSDFVLQGLEMRTTLKFFYNVSLATWLGTTIFFLIITSNLFDQMPDVAGRVASHALPLYFQTGGVCGLIALVSVILLVFFVWKDFSIAKKVTPAVLVLALAGLNYYGGWVVLPKAREVRIEIHKHQAMTKTQTLKQKALLQKNRKRFQRLHNLSIQLFGVGFFLIGVTIIFSSFILKI